MTNMVRRAPRLLPIVTFLMIAGIAAVALYFAAGTASANANAVTGVSVSPGTSAGEILISWNAHPDNPTDYRVLWALDGEKFRSGNKTARTAFVTGTSHTVTGLTPGATYKAKIRARWSSGPNAPFSSVATGNAAEAAPAATPTPQNTDTTDSANPDPFDDTGTVVIPDEHLHIPWQGHTVVDIDTRRHYRNFNPGNLTSATDVDWFRLPSLPLNRPIRFRIADDRFGHGDLKMALYDSSGDIYDQNGYLFEYTDSRFSSMTVDMVFIPDTLADYYLGISSESGKTGQYWLKYFEWNQPAEGDRGTRDCTKGYFKDNNPCRLYPNTTAEGHFNDRGSTVNDTFDIGDEDIYQIFIRPGASYNFCVTTTSTGNFEVQALDGPLHFWTSGIGPTGGREVCDTINPQDRGMRLEVMIRAWTSSTNGRGAGGNYTVSFSTQ